MFWETICCLRAKQTQVATFIKDTNSVRLKHQKGILNCWREKETKTSALITAAFL